MSSKKEEKAQAAAERIKAAALSAAKGLSRAQAERAAHPLPALPAWVCMTANGLPLSRNERVCDESQAELAKMVVSKYCVEAVRSAAEVWLR